MMRMNRFVPALVAAVCAGVCSAADYTLTAGSHAGSEFTDLSGSVTFKVPAGETTITGLSVNGAKPVEVALDRECRATVKVEIPAEGYVWVLVTDCDII